MPQRTAEMPAIQPTIPPVEFPEFKIWLTGVVEGKVVTGGLGVGDPPAGGLATGVIVRTEPAVPLSDADGAAVALIVPSEADDDATSPV